MAELTTEDLENQPDPQMGSMRNEASKAIVPFKEVKSAAEVKHGIVHFVSPFSQLSLHTDLNIPPSNWLRSSSKLERHVRDLTWHSSRKPSQFSSIDIAHNSPDLASDVDVITHAANIKKLLKIPYEKSHVSMMVHRVDRTLLLDEFDIHEHLLRKEQAEWGWLKDFYYEYVQRDLHEKMKCIPRPSKSRDNLQNRNMYSKFLYHSLCDAVSDGDVSMVDHQLPVISTEETTLIPVQLPKPRGSQTHREVLWTFEDIKMLIGTDLPVFRDESYYVSLRLRDMRIPINVLTGLDYWLDNLMCNVPEVAMCFHINGIVQKYEVLKTEDIPELENSKFDPSVVTDIAKNILSFLKNNATKEGHTYWLYKGTDDDVVKLYDLTALCVDTSNQSEQNPFTVPLGMLLYRVARNMWTKQTPGKAALMRTLLENCLYLLDESQHPQVCTSATYLLSDIFVPDSSIDDEWSTRGNSSEESSDDESSQESESGDEQTMNTVNVKCLSKSGSVSRSNELMRLKPISESVEDRCREALKFIYRGLRCLECDYSLGLKKPNIVEEQVFCNSDEVIPLHYEPIKKTQEKAQDSQDVDLQMTSVIPEGQSWHVLSKGLLYRKAAYTCLAMAKQNILNNYHVEALKYLKLAFLCFSSLKKTLPHKISENDALLSSLYGLLGDSRLAINKANQTSIDWDKVWRTSPDEEIGLMEMAEKNMELFEYEDLFELGHDTSVILKACITCYHSAIQLASRKQPSYYPLVKREGNAWNELGVFLMQSTQKMLENDGNTLEEKKAVWTEAVSAFDNGIAVFECVHDVANQVLLHCNSGRLMRVVAQIYTNIAQQANTQQFTLTERHFYNQAIDKYKKALQLGSQGYKNIVESVKWELSTTYFNMAALLQDYAPLASTRKEEVENEIVNLMYQSLKFCKQGNTSFASQTMYQFRAATINHRLASLFHNSLREEVQDQKRKHLRTLSEKHYTRALLVYAQMECYVEYLRAQLEYIALLDLCLSGQTRSHGQLKLLLQMLHSLIDCQDAVAYYTQQLSDVLPDSSHIPVADFKSSHKENSDTLSADITVPGNQTTSSDSGKKSQIDESQSTFVKAPSNQTQSSESEKKQMADDSKSAVTGSTSMSSESLAQIQEADTITSIIETKLQGVLLQLVKVYKTILSKKCSNKEMKEKIDELKRLYASSLNHNRSSTESRTVLGRCSFLQTILKQVSNFYHKTLAKDMES